MPIAAVHPVPVCPWPSGWEDVEVVDSVLVPEPAPPPAGAGAGLYDRCGRVPAADRYGRLVSVVA